MPKKVLRTTEHTYTIIYEPVRGGGYQVTAPLLPGLVTYGRSFEEAREMARDAIRCYIEALHKDREKIPSERSLVQEKISVTA